MTIGLFLYYCHASIKHDIRVYPNVTPMKSLKGKYHEH